MQLQLKPACVIDAMTEYYSRSNANVHRAVHTLAGEATEGYETCRKLLKQRYNSDYGSYHQGLLRQSILQPTHGRA